MAITGLAIAKGLAVAAGVTGTAVAAAHAGNLAGLANAISHVPTWTHAHTVLSGLMQR